MASAERIREEAKSAQERAGTAKAVARFAKKAAESVAAKAAETNKPEDKEAAGEAAAKAVKLKKKAADAEAKAKEADKVAKSLPPKVIPDEESPWFGKLYYDGGGGAYWLANGVGGWVKVNEEGTTNILRCLAKTGRRIVDRRLTQARPGIGARWAQRLRKVFRPEPYHHTIAWG